MVSLSFLLQQRFLCTIFPVILQGVNCNPPSEILNARIIATVVDVADVADDVYRVIGSVGIYIIIKIYGNNGNNGNVYILRSRPEFCS